MLSRYGAVIAKLVLLLALLFGPVDWLDSNHATAEGPQSPHTSVSSDGSTVDPVTSGRGEIEAAFEGTDSLPPDISDPEPVPADLPGATSEDRIESIIGPDGRVRVNPTTSFPARAVALITFSGGRCTGWLYGSNVVATAGHCVHTGGSNGQWMTSVRVYPGRNGTSSPYGSCSATRLYSVVGWTRDKDEAYDYGAIKLNCTIGNTTGWFGYFSQFSSLTGLPSIINGYPGDKPLQQWKSVDQIRVSRFFQLFYSNDTTPGMSGGPVYYNRSGCGYCSMAIHTSGLHGSSTHNTYNHGTRINNFVFDNLTAWKRAQ